MPLVSTKTPHLVSVIIPCYNHGRYLSKAIDSVLAQSYLHTEIVVVDDGSADDTRLVTARYAGVKYIHQQNLGVSAARNTGIDNSTGEYLVFLDADDWLFPDAVYTNLQYLKRNPEAGFVSGGHTLVYPGTNDEVARVVNDHHYLHLLEGNYISMHATVMYKRSVFNQIRYDTSLTGCEDYDIYLRVSRQFPVVHHSKQIAVYVIHDANSSGNIPMMLDTALIVLDRQKKYLRNEAEERSFVKGQYYWTGYYCHLMYTYLLNLPAYKSGKKKSEGLAMLRKYNRTLYYKSLILKPLMSGKRALIKSRANFLLRWLHHAGVYQKFVPSPGKIIKGDFNRVSPFSKAFGYERGGPVDRYYIENFLERNVAVIKGRVLEIGDNAYTMRYGGDRIQKSDVLHIEEGYPNATFYGDLSNAPHIPDNIFDCIILTQTLHCIYHCKEALQSCFRILKPGGTLLMTVPGISHIDHGEWKKAWYWSFTNSAIEKMLAEAFPVENTTVETFGNVLVASAFLYGMGVSELTKKQLDHSDSHYQVTITAVAVKPVV